jgi:hypothetical protein
VIVIGRSTGPRSVLPTKAVVDVGTPRIERGSGVAMKFSFSDELDCITKGVRSRDLSSPAAREPPCVNGTNAPSFIIEFFGQILLLIIAILKQNKEELARPIKEAAFQRRPLMLARGLRVGIRCRREEWQIVFADLHRSAAFGIISRYCHSRSTRGFRTAPTFTAV